MRNLQSHAPGYASIWAGQTGQEDASCCQAGQLSEAASKLIQ